MRFSYEIIPRSIELGGGLRLRLLEGGEEVGGGVFPPADDIADVDEALQVAHDDAESTAYEWLDARET